MTDEAAAPANENPAPTPEVPPENPTVTPAVDAPAALTAGDPIGADSVTVEHDALRDVHGWFRHTLKLLVDHAKASGLDIEAEIKKLI